MAGSEGGVCSTSKASPSPVVTDACAFEQIAILGSHVLQNVLIWSN